LPWPLKPIVKLDYCWRLNYMMFKHSLVLAVPMTAIHFVWQNPDCWKLTRKTFPKLLVAINYMFCVILINAVNSGYSVMFEDYW
jgi:hypothetical protein